MASETDFQLVSDWRIAHKTAHTVFEQWQTRHADALPETARMAHVGATSIPGCLTKGDLDIALYVSAEEFDAVCAYCDRAFEANLRSARRSDFAAFEDRGWPIDVGVQLVVPGSKLDVFERFGDLLRSSPKHLEAYNALKRLQNGQPMSEYRETKAEFIKALLEL